MSDWLVVKRELLEAFVDGGIEHPTPCAFDHHGGCQEHGYLSLKPGERCPQAELVEILGGIPLIPLYDDRDDCPTCEGRGVVRGPEWEDWDRQLLGTCPDCKGSGKNV